MYCVYLAAGVPIPKDMAGEAAVDRAHGLHILEPVVEELRRRPLPGPSLEDRLDVELIEEVGAFGLAVGVARVEVGGDLEEGGGVQLGQQQVVTVALLALAAEGTGRDRGMESR